MTALSAFGFRLSALGVLLATAAAAQGRPLTIEDYYQLKTVGAPRMSPDGRQVTFSTSTRTEATNLDSTQTWVVPTDGSSPARRQTPAGRSAAGERGTASPDGRWVAELRPTLVPRTPRVFASDFERRHEERFKGVQFDWLDFQRDGQAFPVPNRADPAVSPPQELFIGAVGDSTVRRQVTSLGLRPTGVEWSRDGKLLVFEADSSYRDELKYGGGEIYVVNREGTVGAVRRITTDDGADYGAPHFSPDGRYVLATRGLSTDAVIAKKMDNGGPTDLVLIPSNGGAERNLTADWDLLPAGARFSPDGRHVYFTGGIGGATHLFRVPTAGGAVEQVTKGERRISGISFDNAMTKMAYLVNVLDAPPDVYVANIDGSNERRLTNVHADLMRDIALSRSDRLQFASKDGTPIEGFLTYPAGFRSGTGPYPLVVINHGGPHSADGYAFDFKAHYFAANGYFVLKVNFRSSTGYGEKFLWGTWGAWGDKDGEDVMAGVDYVLARHPVDRRRVATMGHSYGGFMTNWLITQYPDRFAAAIPGAGIVNWVSDYGTADIARTKETEFYGTPWDDKARNIMIRQSPLTYANRVKAPTLFIHGEVDQRVPYSEAEQMYVALKKNGVPAKMIQYKDMPHGISGSWNNVHRMMNELRWLDQYLKPTNP